MEFWRVRTVGVTRLVEGEGRGGGGGGGGSGGSFEGTGGSVSHSRQEGLGEGRVMAEGRGWRGTSREVLRGRESERRGRRHG